MLVTKQFGKFDEGVHVHCREMEITLSEGRLRGGLMKSRKYTEN